MAAALDFSIPDAIVAALGVILLLPLYLLGATRLPGLASHYAVQFLVSCLVAAALWAPILVEVWRVQAPDLDGVIGGAMVLASGMLVYLEIWGLLTRGYTLAVLRTLFEAGQPLREDDIAERYRGGAGLDWLMRHRVGGLIAARLIVRQDGQLILTSIRGVVIARLYQACILVLGLRQTG
jgi:hypothetical protein